MFRTLVTCLGVALFGNQLVAGALTAPPTDLGLRHIARISGEPRAPLEAAGQPDRPADGSSPGGLLLFVSRGMPRAELAAALAQARDDPAITLVVRGLMPGETFTDTLLAWSRLLARHQTPPALIIDPTLYRRYRVTSVPTLIDPMTGEMIGAPRSAAQSNAPHEQAQTRFFESGAGSYPIAEPDLAEILRDRAERLDLPAHAQAALRRFWRQVAAVQLPRATASRIRRLRPFVHTSNNLRDHGGRLLLRAGSRINPLQTLPLTARILVLDAQDPREIAWAKTQTGDGRHVIHLITNPDREGGWEAWRALQQQLDAPPFLLDRHLAERLDVQVTPSRIEAEGSDLVITETRLEPVP